MGNTVGSIAKQAIITPKGQQQQPTNDKEYLKDVIKAVYDKSNIEVKTELNTSQIMAISRAEMIADVYNIPILKSFTNQIMTLMISKDRKSRKEFTEISKSIMASANQDEEAGVIDKLIGNK